MRLPAALGLIAALVTSPALATLPLGQKAPEFRLPAAQNGQVVTVDSRELRRQGPTVIYFYPAAYTPGCSLEAKLFADHMPVFERLGARVIGISGDDLGTLKSFSVSHCRGRFPVAADQGLKVAAQYDASGSFSGGFAARVSYVVDADGLVRFALRDTDPRKHVDGTLRAVRTLQAPARVMAGTSR